jgi:hypothetical protein
MFLSHNTLTEMQISPKNWMMLRSPFLLKFCTRKVDYWYVLPLIFSNYNLFSFFFFGGTGVWTQGFMLWKVGASLLEARLPIVISSFSNKSIVKKVSWHLFTKNVKIRKWSLYGLPSVFVSCCLRVFAVIASIRCIRQNKTTSLHSSWNIK